MKLKNKLFALLSIALVLFTNITAYAKTDAAGDVNSALGGIVAYKLSESGAADTQGFLDGYLTENAGKTGEWYVVALLGSGESYDYSKYENALVSYVNEANIPSATTREKYALVLKLLGRNDAFIEKTANDSIGELGIMSYVFGLHLLNNDVRSEKFTKEAVIEQLLGMRLSDGGNNTG